MNRNKLSPGLLSILADFETKDLLNLKPQVAIAGLVISEMDLKPVRVPVFIECDPTDSLQDLAAQGIKVNQPEGAVRTAFLPVESLGALTDDTRIQRVHSSRKLHPRMDVASTKTALPAFRNRTHLTGKGSLLALSIAESIRNTLRLPDVFSVSGTRLSVATAWRKAISGWSFRDPVSSGRATRTGMGHTSPGSPPGAILSSAGSRRAQIS
jgi:hypothetical protein